MGQNEIMLIVFGVFALALVIFFIIDKNKKSSGTKDKKELAREESVQGYKGTQKDILRKDMSSFIRFDKIANDMIYQKNGERYTMVIECKGINYELMSEVEQMAVEEGFQTFLNTLKYPVQLYVQTRSIDLSQNIKKYKTRLNEFETRRQEAVARYNNVEDDIDATPEEVAELRNEKLKYSNIAEYVADITKYVERMALNKYLLQRKFYVILSYNKSEIVSTETFTKEEYEDMCYRELYTRAQGIIGALLGCSVQGKILTSNQLAELIYISLNKDDEKALNIRSALDAGFYRLYSTSEDVRIKRQEALDQEIRKEGMKRVELAIKEGIAKGTIVPEKELADEIDKSIDKAALSLVEETELSDNAKEELKNIIITNRKEKLKRRKEERERMLQEYQDEEAVEDEKYEEVKDEVITQEEVELVDENNDADDELVDEEV